MGTFVKAYIVDGEEYELYEQREDGFVTYDLLDSAQSVLVASGLDDVPDDETVVALVRHLNGWEDDAA
ncbi:MAG TPA: hypothetical protein VFA97_09995 [Gaiellaceae bacterium]|nr:hypothetical protein [Gaiellaceae bacterium]